MFLAFLALCLPHRVSVAVKAQAQPRRLLLFLCVCVWAAVAFYNGQKQERHSSDMAFESLYWRMRSLFKRSFFLLFFVYFQGNVGPAFSLLIVALFIVSNGNLEGQPVTEGTSQSALAAIAQLTQSLAALPAMYSMAGQLAGITHRCAQLFEALHELQVTSCDIFCESACGHVSPPWATKQLTKKIACSVTRRRLRSYRTAARWKKVQLLAWLGCTLPPRKDSRCTATCHLLFNLGTVY